MLTIMGTVGLPESLLALNLFPNFSIYHNLVFVECSQSNIQPSHFGPNPLHFSLQQEFPIDHVISLFEDQLQDVPLFLFFLWLADYLLRCYYIQDVSIPDKLVWYSSIFSSRIGHNLFTSTLDIIFTELLTSDIGL